MKINTDKLSYSILLALVFIMPFFVIPSSYLGIDINKKFLISLGVIVVAVIWLVSRLRDGQILIPKTHILSSAVVVVIVTFFSSIFTTGVRNSLIGVGYELDTFASVLIFMALLFLFSVFFYIFQSPTKFRTKNFFSPSCMGYHKLFITS